MNEHLIKIINERIKLFSIFLNTLGFGFIALGVLTPLSQLDPEISGADWFTILATHWHWLSLGLMSHAMGQIMLGFLKEEDHGA
ncbi:MAG: hypothetical protein AAGE89_04705 [Pseudomonadota bacterium]